MNTRELELVRCEWCNGEKCAQCSWIGHDVDASGRPMLQRPGRLGLFNAVFFGGSLLVAVVGMLFG